MTVFTPSEGWDINLKRKTRSFGFRLWIYFVIFTALIFSVLWLLQTVFLQSFYNEMIIGNTRSAAEKIALCSSTDTVNDEIDTIARNNSLLVYVTDTEGNLLYSSDEFSGIHKKTPSAVNNDYRIRRGEKEQRGYRSLPEEYNEFLEKLISSESSNVELRSDGYYVYGSYIDYYDTEGRSVLYVGAAIDAVGASVNIISMQLVWVTLLSIVVGFVLSWFIAKRFSVPVNSLSEKAKKLGEKDYKTEFKKGFCNELDELSDTLDRANENILESREFQLELLANVSHDLRTPVTMIKGYAEMIKDLSWQDEKQCSEDLSVIIKEADRLSALINEIMEYSELKSEGKLEEFEKLDLSQLVSGSASSFEMLKRPEDVTVEKSISKDIFISGSRSRIERALYNLMDNAARHTDESRRIMVSLDAEKGMAVISVTDFGEGISEEDMKNIWDRYYTTRMRKGKGVSGLGLAIVKQVSELHGGKCSVFSESGKGSTFSIEIPLAEQQ